MGICSHHWTQCATSEFPAMKNDIMLKIDTTVGAVLFNRVGSLRVLIKILPWSINIGVIWILRYIWDVSTCHSGHSLISFNHSFHRGENRGERKSWKIIGQQSERQLLPGLVFYSHVSEPCQTGRCVKIKHIYINLLLLWECSGLGQSVVTPVSQCYFLTFGMALPS